MSELKLPRINRVMLSGRVTRDFALRYTADEVPVASFTVAFNRPVKQKDGSWSEVAGFVNVLVSHRLAELCAERLGKGSALYVEGRLQTRQWSAADGRKRSVLEIKADQVQFLDRGSDETDAVETEKQPAPKEGDLPF